MSQKTTPEVLNGADLILAIDNKALGFSTDCKITTSAETGERVTKERSGGKWGETYVKKLSEQITASGFELKENSDADMPTYDLLKEKMLASSPVACHYSVRDGDGREGKEEGGYQGNYIITSLELDGPAGDDAKYSITLQNSGPVVRKAASSTPALENS